MPPAVETLIFTEKTQMFQINGNLDVYTDTHKYSITRRHTCPKAYKHKGTLKKDTETETETDMETKTHQHNLPASKEEWIVYLITTIMATNHKSTNLNTNKQNFISTSASVLTVYRSGDQSQAEEIDQ